MTTDNKRTKILITGASGFIGSFLCETAINKGYETWAAMRTRSSKKWLKSPELNFITLDLSDKSILRDLEKAIQLSDLHMMPQNDGQVLRLIFPPLTEETKKKLAKEVKASAENMKVGVRSARRDINEELKALEKESLISEDELEEYQEKSQELTDKYIKMLDDLAKEKEAQIMEI